MRRPLFALLVTPTLAYSTPCDRRAAIQHVACAATLFSPTAALAKKKKPEVAKCYDPAFNEVPCASAIPDDLKITPDDLPDSWRAGLGAPVANPNMVTMAPDGGDGSAGNGNANQPLKTVNMVTAPSDGGSGNANQPSKVANAASVKADSIDINNMVAVEFTTFPGLYPTIGGKLVKRGPFTSKAAMYAALDSDAERQALKAYDKGIVIKPRDADLYGYKNAGFYFKGKGGDTKQSNAFRDEEIKRLQLERRQ